MFWDIQKSLSYNALFNFIVGNRGGGKTYGAKKYAVNHFLKTGKQFVYIRRYTKELNKLKQFFADLIKENEFPDIKLEVKGKQFFINNKLAGYALALSTAKIEKSNSFPDVDFIVFDEFILDKGTYRYLPDEVTNFLECYETIARKRNDVRAFFLSNAITVTNPYFLYFNIKLPYNNTIACKNDILIELVQNADFIAAKKETRFGKLIQDTDYGRYSIDNSFLRDNKTFIEKKTGQCNFCFQLIYKGVKIGIWTNWELGKIFCSYDVDENFNIKFAITKEDFQPNTLLLSALKKNSAFKSFIQNYSLGNVYYENIHIKNLIYDIVKLYNIY